MLTTNSLVITYNYLLEVILLQSEQRKYTKQAMKNNLATQYWQKIGELEKQLGGALRRIKKLEKENTKLRNENIEIKMENDHLKQHLFGKKKKDDNNEAGFISLRKKEKKSPKRSPKSYRRPRPTEEEITDTKEYSIEFCPDCGEELNRRKSIERWIEDIPPFFNQSQKRVRYELIHSGYCLRCEKRQSKDRK